MKKTDTLTAEQIGQMRDEYILPSTMKYFPMNIVKGDMQFVYDDKGNKYLDGFSAVVTISVGHCHPEVTNPVIEQFKNLQHMTTLYYHPNLVRYAEKLASVMPGGLKVSFFTNSGCEANELAALLAKNHTKQTEFVGLRHSFHGRTLMAMTMTGQSKWRHSLPYVFGVTHISPGYCYRCPFGLKYPSCNVACARELEDVIKYNTSGKIAAFIGEPIQGFGGVIDPPKEYFEIVYDIVKKYGGLFISRRSADRLWTHRRQVVGDRAMGRETRHDHDGQRHGQRHPARRRDLHERDRRIDAREGAFQHVRRQSRQHDGRSVRARNASSAMITCTTARSWATGCRKALINW